MNTSRPTTEPDGPSPRPDDPDPTAGPAISARWRLSVLIMVLPAAAVLIFGFFTGASVSDMKPHAMPLGIAGPPLTAGDVGRQLATGQHGTFRIQPYTSVGGAEQAVRNREVVAALCGAGPEQSRQGAPVGVGELLSPLRLGEDNLHHPGVYLLTELTRVFVQLRRQTLLGTSMVPARDRRGRFRTGSRSVARAAGGCVRRDGRCVGALPTG